VDECARALEAFEAQAFARDDQPQESARPPLRAVEDEDA
jgi:hypothetical protein